MAMARMVGVKSMNSIYDRCESSYIFDSSLISVRLRATSLENKTGCKVEFVK